MTRPQRVESLWGTLWQTVPSLGRVIRHMRPTWQFASLEALTPAFLSSENIRAIIWDVDGTLTAYHAAHLASSITATLGGLLELPTVRHAVVSNSPESRFRALGALLPDMRVVRVYRLDGTLHTRHLHHGVDSMTTEEVATLIRAGAYALRKPNAELIGRTLAVLDCPAHQAVMVGDQYLTDIAGAGMAGVRSIKIAPVAPSSFPKSLQLAQMAERILYYVRYGRPASTFQPRP